MAKPRFLSLDGVRILVSYFKNQLSGKVDKVDGKSLSDNNFSDEEKAKLAGIEADSQVNVIESISVNGTDQTITNKKVNIDVPLVDDTLQNEGQAADAKATGDAIGELSQSLSSTATEIRGEIADEVADIEQSISAVQESIPTNVSQLNNDAEYADKDYVDGQIDSVQSSIPTNVSDLTNDSNFTTQTYVDTELAKKQDTINFAAPTSSDIGKALMPKTVENGEVTEWKFGEAGMVDDVQINGTSIVENKVANIPVASTDDYGLVKINSNFGINNIPVGNNTYLGIERANASEIKSGTNSGHPIVPYYQHESIFYGLAKASGDTTQSQSDNTVGIYTDEAKASIQTMLDVPSIDIIGAEFDANESYSAGDYVVYEGKLYKFTADHATGAFDGTDAEEITITEEMVSDVTVNGTSIVSGGVANIPIATENDLGVVRVYSNRGVGISDNRLYIFKAQPYDVKQGTNDYRPIVPENQHNAVFYGLTKVAGVDMTSSSNAVGTYTPAAKAAIQTMLGLEIAKTNVSGMTPTIVAEANTRYICGEVTSLDFTPCASGICNVVFTSGSTIAVLTLPQTVKMPEWFEVETNMTYEISIADGVYGAVMSWPV